MAARGCSRKLRMEVLQLTASILLCFLVLSLSVTAQPQVPAVFVFGDSLVDPGNNNYLPATLAKANFPQNGIDFKDGPTGRFCNGRTVVDVTCDLLGVPYPPPFLQPSTKYGENIKLGVNYASAAGGILDASGANYIQRISLGQQINSFQSTTLPQLQAQLGTGQTATLLAKSLTSVVIGNNDFINNYLLSNTNTKFQYSVRSYNILLLNTLNQQLTQLYNFGFRKFVVANTGPIGCIPDQLAIAKTPSCVVSTNDQIQDFNTGLGNLLDQLNSNLAGSHFLYANVYNSVSNLISNPAAYGFTVNNQGCCGGGLYNGQLPCLPTQTACPDRSKYIFWDPYHPTEAANVVLANGLYSGGLDKISPMNVQQLVGV